MIKDLKITLYDIFGYLIPGLVLFGALVIFFWSIFFPKYPLEVSYSLSPAGWIAALLSSYLCGHLAQACANILIRFARPTELSELSGQKKGLPESLVQSAKIAISTKLKIKSEDITPELLYTICDEILVQRGITEYRDVYQYREGFYRGLTVSFVVLLLSLITRVLIPGAALGFSGAVKALKWQIFLFFGTLALSCVVLFYIRYRRFAKYRVRQAVIGALILEKYGTSEKESKGV
mgnify:CR=1 FL=1